MAMMNTNQKFDFRPIQRGDLVVHEGTLGIVSEENGAFATVYLANGLSIHKPLHTLSQLPFQDGVTSPANFSELLRAVYAEGINVMLDHSAHFEELRQMILQREKEKAGSSGPG
jgi:cell wall-associated NlpC family hydrolase